MAAYVLIVIRDIVVANVVVARTVLFKPNAAMRPTWVSIPLDIRTPEAIAILAGTITLTPGHGLGRPVERGAQPARPLPRRATTPTPSATRSSPATSAA